MKINKNRKGFTLVELLAVVVVLGIITAIAVPCVSIVTNNSKLKAGVASAKNYVRGIELKFNSEEPTEEVTWLFVKNSNLTDVLNSGDYPQDGIVTMYKNKVVEAKLCYNNKSVSYSDGEYSVKDDKSFCEYTQNAVVKYMTEKEVELDQVDYDKLDVDVSYLTEENRIFGKQYINPEYVKYLNSIEENDEEGSEVSIIPEPYIDPTWQLAELEEESDTESNVNVDNSTAQAEKLNTKGIESKVKKIATYKDSHYRMDIDDGLNLRMENQSSSGLCWAYTTTTMFESTLQKQYAGTSDIQMSTRHLDFFTAQYALNEMNLTKYVAKNGEIYRAWGGAGSFNVATDAMFTGMAIQRSSEFPDSITDANKKAISKVYNNNNMTYYAKKITHLVNNSYSDKAITALKKSLINNGAAYGSICFNRVLLDSKLPRLINNKDAYILREDGTSCSEHAVSIIGWDDSVGAWIVQNSHGSTSDKAYFYIDYKYERIYNMLATFKEIGVKNWDNSYDSINNLKKTNDSSAIYIDKVKGKEQIVNIGFKKNGSDYKNNEQYYFLNAKDSNQCAIMSNNIKNNVYVINNNKVYDSASSQVGFVVSSPKLTTIGYEINDISDKMIFEDDICIVNKDRNYQNEISVFTKNVAGISSTVEMTVEKLDSTGNYNVETMANGQNGATVAYTVLDSNGEDAVKNGEVTISDNFIVNNVAHANFKFKYEYEYTITSKVGSSTSNTVVINKGITKPTAGGNSQTSEKTELVEVKDTTAPQCTWSANSYKVTKKQKGVFVLTCSDDSGFSDTSISKSNIQTAELLLKKLKITNVSGPTISNNGKTATWSITAERTIIGFGNTKLTLKKNSIADKSKNKNSAVKTKSINVSLK